MLILPRLFFSLLSLLILGAAAYLLWTWWQGELLLDADGVASIAREEWRLWTALGLLAWSFLGGRIVPLLLARADREPTRPERSGGHRVTSDTGSALHVESFGPEGAPAVVLTHGWGLDSTVWRYARHDLAERFRVVVWDLPGLGRSKAAPGRIDLESFARDLRTVIASATVGPVVLVGHSIGGMTLQTLVRDHPEVIGREVAGLVLLNTTYTNPLKTVIFSRLALALRPVLEVLCRLGVWLQPLVWISAWQSWLSGSQHLAARFGFGKYVTRSQLNHTALLMTRNPPAVQAKGNLAMFRWDATGALAGVTVPVLVLGGDKDILTRLEASRTIAGETPQARLQVVEGVNHMGFLERADVYDAAIAAFADQVFAGRGGGG
ncbi:MAG TPA: alpha/beta hydrolase [Caulobacteraceae bacterium]